MILVLSGGIAVHLPQSIDSKFGADEARVDTAAAAAAAVAAPLKADQAGNAVSSEESGAAVCAGVDAAPDALASDALSGK